jgi:hypothetical protein
MPGHRGSLPWLPVQLSPQVPEQLVSPEIPFVSGSLLAVAERFAKSPRRKADCTIATASHQQIPIPPCEEAGEKFNPVHHDRCCL